jgi:Zn-dependent protease with chaperone function
MKILNLFLFIIITYSSLAQDKTLVLDTSNADSFKLELLEFYKSKYAIFNKSLTLNSAEKSKISKTIYLEYQEEFLEKINKNNFISDKNLNDYFQKLIFEILDKNKLNKKEYKILISKDPEINAYNCGDGTIVVNYGLLNILDNEDELVFVLCHEISHQELQHVKKEIDNFVSLHTSEEIIDKTKEIKKLKYNRTRAANTFLLKLNYKNYAQRRKKEIEADSLGFYFYSKMNRDLSNSVSLLAKLNESNREKDSLVIKDYRILFETETFKLKNKHFEIEKSIFNKYDYKPSYQIDSLKTHPDCLTRIKKIEKFITNQNFKSSSSEIFVEIKKNVNYQNLYNLYLSGEFGVSLYESLKKYKVDNNVFYKDLIFLNLAEILKAKENQTLSKHVPQIDYVYNSTSLNRFINLMNNLKISDIEILIQKFK